MKQCGKSGKNKIKLFPRFISHFVDTGVGVGEGKGAANWEVGSQYRNILLTYSFNN